MAFPFKGRTSAIVTSSINNLPKYTDSFTIANNGASTVFVNVYLINASLATEVRIAPGPIELASGEMYEGTNNVVILASEQIKIHPTGSVDYNFTINDLE